MNNYVKALLCSVVLALGASQSIGAQVALKTNLLYDAALSPNLGIEVAVAPKWSLDLSGNLNAWTLDNGRRWKHWLVQPEVRYWFCDRFSGHFVGAHLLGGQVNVGGLDHSYSFLGKDIDLHNRRYQGWYGGAGVAYGYTWILAKHWSLEAEIGVGWIYTRYDVFPCRTCGTKLATDRTHNYFGPTKAAINLVYVF